MAADAGASSGDLLIRVLRFRNDTGAADTHRDDPASPLEPNPVPSCRSYFSPSPDQKGEMRRDGAMEGVRRSTLEI